MVYAVAFICLVVLVLHKVKVEGCLQSIPTMTVVDNCPRNITEWIKSKNRKQCHLINQTCTSPAERLEYHCLSDKFQEHFYEVCAPRKHIVGGHCPFYDNEKNSIEENLYLSCKDHATSCPDVYNSSMAYKYQECYTYATKQNPYFRINKECECSVKESVFAKVFYISICFIHLMMLLMFIYSIKMRNHMPGLYKPEEINANNFVKYGNKNGMKCTPSNIDPTNLNCCPRNESLHETSADSSNSTLVFLPENKKNISFI